jgi:hypothetical protein
MKSLKSFIQLFTAIAAVSFALVAGADMPAVPTALAVGASISGIYVAYATGYLKLPSNAFFDFVGVPGGVGADGSPGIQVISTERDRAIHLNNSLKAEYAGKTLVPGFLRMEATIKNNSGIIKFSTQTGDSNTVYATEKRLDRNDAFIVTDMGVFLLKQDIANGKTNGLPYSYPNRTIFGAATDDLLAIFTAGVLDIEVNKKREIPDLDLLRFLQIPQVQQSTANNFDETNLKKALKPVTPQFRIDGSGTNDIKITFPTYAGFAGASAVAGTEHRVVLYLHGLFVQGGSVNS